MKTLGESKSLHRTYPFSSELMRQLVVLSCRPPSVGSHHISWEAIPSRRSASGLDRRESKSKRVIQDQSRMLVSQDLFSLCKKIRDQSHELKLSGNIRQQFIGYNEASAIYHKGYLSIQVISNYRYIDHVGRPIYI